MLNVVHVYDAFIMSNIDLILLKVYLNAHHIGEPVKCDKKFHSAQCFQQRIVFNTKVK